MSPEHIPYDRDINETGKGLIRPDRPVRVSLEEASSEESLEPQEKKDKPYAVDALGGNSYSDLNK